ncbi:RTA1 domain-containing protein [Diaporthe helianthi]|uniref:RTA1 domain-containing protein n=1 Tax=Diaporthe helianthi TaxID=158607 RepID=A0A2P5HJ26_DIAHE|nr:RTA1 domain-containing protein [Diaporthe helianthi]
MPSRIGLPLPTSRHLLPLPSLTLHPLPEPVLLVPARRQAGEVKRVKQGREERPAVLVPGALDLGHPVGLAEEDVGRRGEVPSRVLALLKASLILQLVIVNTFVVLAVTFYRRVVKAGIHNRRVNSSMLTLYVSTALIEARTIYRTVENFGLAGMRIQRGGADLLANLPPELRYEWFFYVFEASLMLANAVLWNVRPEVLRTRSQGLVRRVRCAHAAEAFDY